MVRSFYVDIDIPLFLFPLSLPLFLAFVLYLPPPYAIIFGWIRWTSDRGVLLALLRGLGRKTDGRAVGLGRTGQ